MLNWANDYIIIIDVTVTDEVIDIVVIIIIIIIIVISFMQGIYTT